VTGSETSKVAAQRIRGGANTLRQRVLTFIIERGSFGATDEEIQAGTGLKCQTETPRRRELVQLGLVVDSGRRRPTSSGRPATVWVMATAERAGNGA
jgi:hypothetical protein